ncbi:MAG: hypothetical protein KAU21_19205 [Gammaproteobacteria bacterium]|nr:hypothetical protein [Gammaproteobacteria bacterium]
MNTAYQIRPITTGKPSIRRDPVDYTRQVHNVSQQRTCRVAGISGSVYKY